MKRLLSHALLLASSLISVSCARDRPILDGGARAGGLSIEALQRSARSFNANQGFATVEYVEFRVLHAGRVIAVAGESGQPLREVRDAWVLTGAPRPAVLMGSAGWTLVTEMDGRLQVTALTPHGSDNSVQWLDTPGGPGPVHRSRMRTDARDPRRLEGGHRLLVGGEVVLDVETLQWRRLTPCVPAGYQSAGHDPAVWPAAGGALVSLYRGETHSPHDALLVVSDPATGVSHLAAFDLASTGRREFLLPDTAWLDAHFELVATSQGGRLLRQRLQAPPAGRWQARYHLGAAAAAGPSGAVQRLVVSPVQPKLLKAVRALAAAELGAVDAPPQSGDPSPETAQRMQMWLGPLMFRFDAVARALMVESEGDNTLSAQAAVLRVGQLLDERMADGSLSAHLAPAAPAATNETRQARAGRSLKCP